MRVPIDVATIAPPEEFAQRIHSLIDEIHAAPAAVGIDRVLVPGEREWNTFHRSQAEGIDLPEDVVAKLRQVASEYGQFPDWLRP